MGRLLPMDTEPDMLKAIEEGASAHRVLHLRIEIVPLDDCAGRLDGRDKAYQRIACALFQLLDKRVGGGETVASMTALD